MDIFLGIIIPLIGTSVGAGAVFLMKKHVSSKIESILLGFASGVMIAASIWSLIMPSIDMANNQHIISWLPASIGFLGGILFLILLDKIVHKLSNNSKQKVLQKKKSMMVLAITLHNIPEGMAVGVAFAGAMLGNSGITMAAAFALSIGIAIQNFPEGAIISMPLKSSGMSKGKAFLYGVLSGVVEPIGAFITILLTNLIVQILPYLLSFAAGAMIYVVVEELIPEYKIDKNSKIGTIGVGIGFILMMILDVMLG